MAYADTLDPATPDGSALIAQGDDRIRELKRTMIERIESMIVDIDVDPWAIKDTFLHGTILPSLSTKDIGAAGSKWQDLFLSRNALIGGTLGVTGITTLTGALNANGGIVIAASQALTGTVANSTISGFLSVAATTGTFTNVGGTLSTATQNSVTTMTALVTVGALAAGSTATGFGALVGTSVTSSGAISGTAGSFSEGVLAGKQYSAVVATATPTTMFTVADTEATYLVTAKTRTGAENYITWAMISYGRNSVIGILTSASTSGDFAISVTGATIRITQAAGADREVGASLLKLT